ncbi:hypothetical protein OQA88_12993 [Cercophora sp. LCS_1]
MDIVILDGLNPLRMNLAYGARGIIAAESPGSRIWMLDNARDCNLPYEAPPNEVVQTSRSILSKLLSARTSNEERQRPIVFVGIAMGGALVKQAILLTHIEDEFTLIRDSTKAAIFLGTPHREGRDDEYAQILLRITKASDPYNQALDGVAVNSGYLRQLTSYCCDNFRHLPVFTIIQPELLVSRESATLGSQGEVHISIEAEHEQGDKLRGLREVSRCIQRIGYQAAAVADREPWLANPYSTKDLPPASCPICSALTANALVGSETPPLKYSIDLGQPAQDDLRLWARCCVVAHFAYRVSSLWLGRSAEGVKRDRGNRGADLRGQEACFGRVGSQGESWGVERQRDGSVIFTGSIGHIGLESDLEARFVLSAEHNISFKKDVEYTVVHRDPLSEPTLQHMTSWILSCNDQHGCYQGAEASLPSRLLDVRNLDHVVLFDSTDLEDRGGDKRYATLSHCWGSSRDFLTTRQSLSNMKKGFPISEVIPRTFSDAMLATHRLGIPYLWIDSLCIIQYDAGDWAVEASRMASVYRNSYITIAAASSTGDEQGFLQPRAFEYATVEFTSPKGESAVAYMSRETRLPNNSTGQDYPLFRRAWVLQEQYLSPRTLIFSKAQAFYFCQGVGRSIGVRSYAEKGVMKSHKDLSKSFDKMRLSWRNATKELSTRLLTYDTDKLPSIAGVASTRSIMDKGVQRQYCGGIWRDDLPMDLLFYHVGEAEPPSDYLAPSWSWAALNGPVSWLVDESRGGKVPGGWATEVLLPLDSVEIIDCEMVVKDDRSPYGQVQRGSSLTVRAQFAELEPCPASSTGTADVSKVPRWQLEPQEEWSPFPVVRVGGMPSSSETKLPQEIMGRPYKVIGTELEATVWCRFDIPGRVTDKVVALVVAYKAWNFHHGIEAPELQHGTELVGLLVTPVSDESGSDGYQRVGVFGIQTEDGVAERVLEDFSSQTAVLY